MNNLNKHIKNYLDYGEHNKRLDTKTIKAYRIDLSQFCSQIGTTNVFDISHQQLDRYISELHQKYTPKTVKRKIASIKAFFHYLEYKEVIELNPFNKLQIRFREPFILPKVIPLHIVEAFLSCIYNQHKNAKTSYQRRNALRDAAVIELLFSTGIRISELCFLGMHDVNLQDKTILIYGKGSKERKIQIGNDAVINILRKYHDNYRLEIQHSMHFFSNQKGGALSDQAVRRMINKYTSLAAIELHITPHMFRHTFATSLLDADVDIRYIQELLGHSSINITEIYTHVTMSKQNYILTTKHPRKDFNIHA